MPTKYVSSTKEVVKKRSVVFPHWLAISLRVDDLMIENITFPAPCLDKTGEIWSSSIHRQKPDYIFFSISLYIYISLYIQVWGRSSINSSGFM